MPLARAPASCIQMLGGQEKIAMLRYLIRRILSMIPLLIVVTAFTFIVGQYGAGDLAAYLAGTRGRRVQRV